MKGLFFQAVEALCLLRGVAIGFAASFLHNVFSAVNGKAGVGSAGQFLSSKSCSLVFVCFETGFH